MNHVWIRPTSSAIFNRSIVDLISIGSKCIGENVQIRYKESWYSAMPGPGVNDYRIYIGLDCSEHFGLLPPIIITLCMCLSATVASMVLYVLFH